MATNKYLYKVNILFKNMQHVVVSFLLILQQKYIGLVLWCQLYNIIIRWTLQIKQSTLYFLEVLQWLELKYKS